MNTVDQIETIREVVEKYFESNAPHSVPLYILSDPSARDHIIQIGTSILCTKWKIGYLGGSFVQAVVNNDLRGAMGSADTVNVQALKFYCQLMYNVGMPSNLNSK